MKSLLIIDDSPEDRELFVDLLHSHNPELEIEESPSGRDGVNRARTSDFDCVLLDLRLGSESGLDVLAELQAVLPLLPVVVLTGLGSEKTAVEAFVNGAAYYLPKNDLTGPILWTAVSRVSQKSDAERELKAKTEAIERSNRLDAIGQLAAGIAHDFNNQLGALRYCVELMEDWATTPAMNDHVEKSLKIIDESADLARRMLSLARQDDLMAQNVKVSEIFSNLSALVNPSQTDSVKINFHPLDVDSIVWCDPNQLLNSLLNLVLNARDAILAGVGKGVIAIEAGSQNDTVQISVKDDGAGMSEGVLAKCSDPFFTTKQDTNGTGLGLTTVQGFVNGNNGELRIQSSKGTGTKVTIVLPLGANEERVSEEPISALPRYPNDVSVLVVDDHPIVRDITRRVLEKNGILTKVACDGEEALKLMSSGNAPDVLITDLNMPNLNGFELAKQVRQKFPKTGIIYFSGYADATEIQTQDLLGPVLPKPTPSGQLLKTIEKTLRSAKSDLQSNTIG